MVYNLTNLTSANTYPQVLQRINELSGNFFGIALIVTIFVVSFLSLKNYSTERAFAGSMLITTILGIFLRILEIIPDYMMGFLIIATGGALMFLI